MRLSDLSVARRDLAEWSEPLIADRVGEIYAICFSGDQQRIRPMTRQHCRLWRNLLLQDSSRVQNARRELVRLGKLAGVESHTLDRIDEAVFDELAEVVVARFHRSPMTTRDYSKSLIRAASSLAEARFVA
jgi:hypothetical protein